MRGLHDQEGPYGDGRGERKAKDAHIKHHHKEMVHHGIHDEAGDAGRHGELRPVLKREKGKQLLADQQRGNADGLPVDILIQHLPDLFFLHEAACQAGGGENQDQ